MEPNYELRTFIIGFRQVEGRHFSSKLDANIEYELNRLGIFEKVCSLTTDNGADIKKVKLVSQIFSL